MARDDWQRAWPREVEWWTCATGRYAFCRTSRVRPRVRERGTHAAPHPHATADGAAALHSGSSGRSSTWWNATMTMNRHSAPARPAGSGQRCWPFGRAAGSRDDRHSAHAGHVQQARRLPFGGFAAAVATAPGRHVRMSRQALDAGMSAASSRSRRTSGAKIVRAEGDARFSPRRRRIRSTAWGSHGAGGSRHSIGQTNSTGLRPRTACQACTAAMAPPRVGTPGAPCCPCHGAPSPCRSPHRRRPGRAPPLSARRSPQPYRTASQQRGITSPRRVRSREQVSNSARSSPEARSPTTKRGALHARRSVAGRASSECELLQALRFT